MWKTQSWKASQSQAWDVFPRPSMISVYRAAVVWRACYFTCIILLNSCDMRVYSHEDVLSLLYGWIGRLKEKLRDLSEFMGRRSGNNKWIQVSLTPECRRPTVTKQWTQIIRKGHLLHSHLPSSSRLMENPAGEPLHTLGEQVHKGKAQFLSKHKSWSYFRVTDVCPEMTLACVWVWIFWNISPINFASGTPADNTRVSPLGPQENVFQQMRNLLAGKL